jgi:hypothetical protein
MTTYKRYLLSSAITFVSAFAIIVIPNLATVSYTKAALLSVLAMGVRAGFKALGEYVAGANADMPNS